jgi:uncharacterized protein YydD (DUF2326 family)
MITLRANIMSLEHQRGLLHRLQEMQTEIRELSEVRRHPQTKVKQDVERQNADQSSLFSTIRLLFTEIVEEVIDRKGLLSV